MTRRRSPTGFRTKCRFIRKILWRFVWKVAFNSIFLANSSKSFQSSGSLKDLWTGEKSNPFSKTWISVSDNALQLRLKTVLEQSVPARCPSSVIVAFVGKPSDLTTELPILTLNFKEAWVQGTLKGLNPFSSFCERTKKYLIYFSSFSSIEKFNSTILRLCFPVAYGYYNFFQ